MKITISRIPKKGLNQTFTAPAVSFPVLSQLIDQEGMVFTHPIHAEVTLQVLADETVSVNGEVSTSLNVGCGRCLEPYACQVARTFDVGFIAQAAMDVLDDIEGKECEIREEDIGMDSYVGDIIDLRETIQEQVVMSLPQHPLCSDGCKGLCQECGANLNTSSCTCPKEIGHPAFAVLKGLKP